MKNVLKLFPIVFLGLNAITLSGQNDSIIVQGDSVVSGDLSDWNYYSSIRVIQYKQSTQPTRLFAEMYDYENVRVMVTDSTSRLDSTSGHDTLYVDGFLDFEHLGFEYPFAQSLEDKNILKSGTYSLKFTLYDTSFHVLDTARKTIRIDNKWPAQIKGFWDSKEIYSKCLDTMNYPWVHPDTPSATLYYKFRIHKVPANYDGEYEGLIFDSIPVYDTVLYGIRQHRIDTLKFKFQVGKDYVISVLSAYDNLFQNRLVVNKGLSVPFLVHSSSNPVKLRGSEDVCALFNNGFEDGTLNGFTTIASLNTSGPDNTKPTLFKSFTPTATGEVLVVNKFMIDPDAPVGCVPLGGGNNACRLGDLSTHSPTGMNIFGISKTFTVTQNTANIKFSHAMVLQDGEHPRVQQPFIKFQSSLKRRWFLGTSSKIVDNKLYVARTGDPIFTVLNDINYRIWDCASIDLHKYINKSVTIAFVASDCEPGAHFGRSYIDFCVNSTPSMDFTMNSVYCQNSGITLNGSASTGALNWYWSIVKTNSSGTTNLGNESSSDKFFGTTSMSFSLTDFLVAKGIKLECNSYYKVTLTGGNDCAEVGTKSKIFFIECPGDGAAGIDKCCTSGSCSVQIGTTAKSGYSYAWSPSNCLSSTTTSNPYFNSPCSPNTPTTWPHKLTLTVTSPAGCTGTDDVYIYKNTPSNLTLTRTSISTCTDKITVTGNDLGDNIVWRNQKGDILGSGTEITYLKNDQIGNLITVTCTNACGSATASIAAATNADLVGAFPTLLFPTAMRPAVDPIIDALPIWDWTKANGTPNSYNATDYRLRVYNRWGEKIFEGIRTDGPWNNGDVWWNAKPAGSNQWVPNGLYVWTLDLKNCSHGEWSRDWSTLMLVPDESKGKKWSIWCFCYKYKAYKWVTQSFPNGAEVIMAN